MRPFVYNRRETDVVFTFVLLQDAGYLLLMQWMWGSLFLVGQYVLARMESDFFISRNEWVIWKGG
jgi:hypothetical protein